MLQICAPGFNDDPTHHSQVRSAEEASRLLQLHAQLGGRPPNLLEPARRLLLELQVQLAPHTPVRSSQAAARSTARPPRRKFLLVLLSDVVLLASVRKSRRSLVSRAIGASGLTTGLPQLAPSRRSSRRSERPSQGGGGGGGGGGVAVAGGAAGGTTTLRLKALLPLRHCRLQLSAPAASLAPGLESDRVPSLLLQCRSPAVQYTCCCDSAHASRALLDAFAAAVAQLSASNLQPDPAAVAAEEEAARRSASRRRLSLSMSRRSSASATSTIPAAELGVTAVPSRGREGLASPSAGRAERAARYQRYLRSSDGGASDEEDEEGEESIEVGYVLSSDSESEGSSTSSRSSAEEA